MWYVLHSLLLLFYVKLKRTTTIAMSLCDTCNVSDKEKMDVW